MKEMHLWVVQNSFLSISHSHLWKHGFSYLMLFSIFQAITNYMKNKEQFEEYKITQGFGIFAMTLMLWELTYYLAYYKDIIFAFFDCIIFLGIFFRNFTDNKETLYVKQCSLACFIISALFLIITFLHSFESAFYLKYFSIIKKLKNVEDAITKNEEDIFNHNNYYVKKIDKAK